MASQYSREVAWADVWLSTAEQLDKYRAVGLQALLTEDVLRFAVIQELVALGVAPSDIEAEWRRPGVTDAVDLVVMQPARAALEFKFPREPRETNAAWTQHLGEVLKDFYRLAYMPTDFTERWCVQLLSSRVIRYLDGVADRLNLRVALQAGGTTVFKPDVVRGLPRTALKALSRWEATPRVVRSRCEVVHRIGSELRLLVHAVEAVAVEKTPSPLGQL